MENYGSEQNLQNPHNLNLEQEENYYGKEFAKN